MDINTIHLCAESLPSQVSSGLSGRLQRRWLARSQPWQSEAHSGGHSSIVEICASKDGHKRSADQPCSFSSLFSCSLSLSLSLLSLSSSPPHPPAPFTHSPLSPFACTLSLLALCHLGLRDEPNCLFYVFMPPRETAPRAVIETDTTRSHRNSTNTHMPAQEADLFGLVNGASTCAWTVGRRPGGVNAAAGCGNGGGSRVFRAIARPHAKSSTHLAGIGQGPQSSTESQRGIQSAVFYKLLFPFT